MPLTSLGNPGEAVRRCLVTTAAALVALAVTPNAVAGVASLSVQEMPVDGDRALAAAVPKQGFDYLGLHWKGAGSVSFRVLRENGRWSGWARADRDAGADVATSEAARSRGWAIGEGVWVGRATRVEVRAAGAVSRVRAFTVRSPVSRLPTRKQASAGEPVVVSRQGWQADEALRRDDPQTSASLRFAVVHHTAGTNDYRREDGPAIVRAIQLYHVKGNGWNDIGYNALVDRFGTVYEGRWGGLGENIIGAHAKGFNTGSFGIAVMGEFTTTAPPAAAREALARTIAWRLDRAHADPLATFDAISGGNERFAPGIPVFLRGVSGHRDTGLTACPGQRLYDLLPALAARAAAIGLPKLYEPVMTGTGGGPLTFTARLSSSLPWVFTATGPSGAPVFETSGTGRAVSVTWDTTGLEPGAYSWRIAAAGVTPADGSFDIAGTDAALAITAAAAEPAVIAPDGDGTLDTATLTYTLTAAANVGITVHDQAGTQLAVLEAPRWRRSGPHTLSFDGLGLPDGVVELRMLATATEGRTATSSIQVAITRTLGHVALKRAVLSPNGDGHDDRLTVRFSLAGPASVRLLILREGRWTATPFSSSLQSGRQVIYWDGAKRVGTLREGAYVAVLEAADAVGTARVTLPFLADWTPPKVSFVSLDPLRLRVSEPATLRIRADGLRRRVRVAVPGLVRIPAVRRPRLLVVTALDEAGNQSEPLRRPAD